MGEYFTISQLHDLITTHESELSDVEKMQKNKIRDGFFYINATPTKRIDLGGIISTVSDPKAQKTFVFENDGIITNAQKNNNIIKLISSNKNAPNEEVPNHFMIDTNKKIPQGASAVVGGRAKNHKRRTAKRTKHTNKKKRTTRKKHTIRRRRSTRK